MKSTINCCYNCKNRHLGCHSECKAYINAKANHELEKARESEYDKYLHDREIVWRRFKK